MWKVRIKQLFATEYVSLAFMSAVFRITLSVAFPCSCDRFNAKKPIVVFLSNWFSTARRVIVMRMR